MAETNTSINVPTNDELESLESKQSALYISDPNLFAARESAMAKLAKLGLTVDEINAAFNLS